jgi:retron-type reverse transcriptase
MQIKLHRWAAADHGFRFDDVFNFVCDPATLVMAFERVAGNTGARTAGVDGVRADHVRAAGAEAYLDRIRSQLRAGVFRPMPVRERMIPKTGGKLRRLGIPIIADRVVQAALKLVLDRSSRRTSVRVRTGAGPTGVRTTRSLRFICSVPRDIAGCWTLTSRRASTGSITWP